VDAAGGDGDAYAWDGAGNRVGAGAAAYAYDERNRLVSGPEGTYAWSARGTLESVTSAAGSETFGHDALGRLVDYDGTATYAWDGLDRLASRSGVPFSYAGTGIDPVSDGTTLYSLSPEGDPLAVSDAAGARLALQDRHGDLGVLFGLGGDVLATRAYDPFGAVAGTTGASSAWPAAGYQSDFTDPASHKVWMGTRWYDPTAGAFVSRDGWSGVAATPVTLNRYTYAAGDPLAYFDPDGRAPWDAARRWAGRAVKRAAEVVEGAVDTVVSVVGGAVDRVASATAALAANVRTQAARAQHRIASSARAGGRRLVSGARTAARAAAAPVRACMSSGACRTAVVAAAVVTTAVVCSVCAAGMLMGGAFGTAAGVATCGGDWGCVGRSGLAGAAGGALAPLGGAGLGGAILGGALSSAGSGGAGQFMAGRFDADALRRDALVGAGTGAAFHALGGLRGSLRGRGGSAARSNPGISQRLRNRIGDLSDETGALGGGATRLTNAQATDMAHWSGFRPAGNWRIKGQQVFTDGQRYIVQDIDSHLPDGLWKMAGQPEDLLSKKTRMGTYDYVLNRIGD
jgi:RHS repeat-associated protein